MTSNSSGLEAAFHRHGHGIDPWQPHTDTSTDWMPLWRHQTEWGETPTYRCGGFGHECERVPYEQTVPRWGVIEGRSQDLYGYSMRERFVPDGPSHELILSDIQHEEEKGVLSRIYTSPGSKVDEGLLGWAAAVVGMRFWGHEWTHLNADQLYKNPGIFYQHIGAMVGFEILTHNIAGPEGDARHVGVRTPPTGYIYIDTHVHSSMSHDSVASIRQILLRAQALGMQAIAITEHDRLGGPMAERVKRKMQAEGVLRKDFVVIPGMEITSRDGHIVGLYVDGTIAREMPAADTVAAIQAQGGLAIAAHPFRSSGVGASRLGGIPFDGVEAINASNFVPMAQVRDGAARTEGQLRLGVSDGHIPEALGFGVTLLAVTEVTDRGVRDALVAASVGARTEAGGVIARPMTMVPIYQAYLEYLYEHWPQPILSRAQAIYSFEERLRIQLADWLGVDDIDYKTTWNRPVNDALSVVLFPRAVVDVIRGKSALWGPLLPTSVFVDKGPFRLEYVFEYKYDRDLPLDRVYARREPKPFVPTPMIWLHYLQSF